jgi:signal transduction histidine kinase
MENDKVFPAVPGATAGGLAETRSDHLLPELKELQEEFEYLIHEIRSPLTAVIAAGELLKGFNLPTEEKASVLDGLLEEARRINGLLHEFFQVYHEDAGTWLSKMTFSTIQVPDLLQETVARFRNASPKYRLQVSLAADLPPVRGDRPKLDLVLRNLIANALKYSPEGGAVLLSAWRSDDRVVVSVQDEGLGIPEESLESIFEKSFRVDRPETRKMCGAGLGLTMVRRIVENHGDRIWVESTQGKGSAFYFSLQQATADTPH